MPQHGDASSHWIYSCDTSNREEQTVQIMMSCMIFKLGSLDPFLPWLFCHTVTTVPFNSIRRVTRNADAFTRLLTSDLIFSRFIWIFFSKKKKDELIEIVQ